ncbi:type VI secretion system-associated FHA domain protein TagH [Erwinia phyllosphaerae]|uniref:type VI secretion system-associated FHA domain protein TagH n=1 Tax=Erwinia phyllosphaerae TaxID=2853256 RepID=UPI001FEE91C5|nr:type VI secretion system-associated FHA domain protein TagH [Erwinia phyllosphaerae]MBV4368234.1 type VI secretion system-associated FHA domain protein TagH [Erwinia phyllosphaerae]
MRFTIIATKPGQLPPQSSCDFLPPGGTIGRGTDNNLVLPDDDRTISRLQAIVHITADGECRITNRGNVTLVHLNDIPLERGRQVDLQDGDILSIDDYRLQVTELHSAQPAARPAPVARPVVATPKPENAPAAIPTEIWDSLAQEFSITDSLSSRGKPTPAGANPLTEKAEDRNPVDPLAQLAAKQDPLNLDRRDRTPDSLFSSESLFDQKSIFDDSTPGTLSQPQDKKQSLDPMALFGQGNSTPAGGNDPLGLMMGNAVPLTPLDEPQPAFVPPTPKALDSEKPKAAAPQSPRQDNSASLNRSPLSNESTDLNRSPLFGNNEDLNKSPLFGDSEDLNKSPLFGESEDLSKSPLFAENADLKSPLFNENANRAPLAESAQDDADFGSTSLFGENADLSKSSLFGESADLSKSPLFDESADLSKSPLFDESTSRHQSMQSEESANRSQSVPFDEAAQQPAAQQQQQDYGGITLPTPQAVARNNTPPPKGRLRIDPVANTAAQQNSTAGNGQRLDGELLDALMGGMGLNDLQPTPRFDSEAMQELGQMLSMFSQGTVALLSSRSILKRGVKAEMTVILDEANNPFKLLPSGKSVLMQMFGSRMPGFMPPKQSVRDALVDLQAHQLGMIAGIRAIIASMLQSFNPQQLEDEAREEGAISRLSLPNSRKAALWEHFTKRYGETAGEIEDDFHTLFGEAFLHAYDMEVNQYKDSQIRSEE